MIIDELLNLPPYETNKEKKREVFYRAMQESFRHHMKNCSVFRKFCEKRKFNIDKPDQLLDDFPYLPVSIFKDVLLESASQGVSKIIRSSATTGSPSQISIDSITAKYQRMALMAILRHFLGAERVPFVVFDVDPVSEKQSKINLSARSSALRGFLMASKGCRYVLSSGNGLDQMVLDEDELIRVFETYKGQPFVIFGFTYILHYFAKILFERGLLFPDLEAKLIHIGGWKKLQASAVSKMDFSNMMQKVFGVSKNCIIDVYGFTEQLGIVYPDCPMGVKHVPAFSEVIVRDPHTLRSCSVGETGLLQFLTPIPHSYPGVSIVTDDIGRLVQEEGCPCGWKGTTFEVLGRAPKSEPRGCGDILAEQKNIHI